MVLEWFSRSFKDDVHIVIAIEIYESKFRKYGIIVTRAFFRVFHAYRIRVKLSEINAYCYVTEIISCLYTASILHITNSLSLS